MLFGTLLLCGLAFGSSFAANPFSWSGETFVGGTTLRLNSDKRFASVASIELRKAKTRMWIKTGSDEIVKSYSVEPDVDSITIALPNNISGSGYFVKISGESQTGEVLDEFSSHFSITPAGGIVADATIVPVKTLDVDVTPAVAVTVPSQGATTIDTKATDIVKEAKPINATGHRDLSSEAAQVGQDIKNATSHAMHSAQNKTKGFFEHAKDSVAHALSPSAHDANGTHNATAYMKINVHQIPFESSSAVTIKGAQIVTTALIAWMCVVWM